ncbi:glycerol kinase GlpK [Parvularcula dongshanensis]|uniref:glycerol kinase n=1 Tax=Parvularcula dongshanensis TaxID=1173995 RepID=A0A840I1W8_9PROT|nr:glycerol kinase GlpK [Parvularcula dongshanensis]MBB4658060.1 glycerol kinase [Parvularcula dongshanensis]
MPTILALDQGTTSSRALLIGADGRVLDSAQEEFPQRYPRDGWVEHDPEAIWDSQVRTARAVLERAEETPAALGITNQRETVVVWDRKTGAPIAPAIVWQDRRTALECRRLREAGHDALIAERTGLLIDPYFSATKLAWLLDHTEGARARAEAGELAAGTIDSFLLWRLTGGAVHATDATNACRTSLFGLDAQDWDDELLDLFRVPRALLPDVRDCASDFGTTTREALGVGLPVGGIAGDQQAALIGQACLAPGMIKSTYGTGCFVVLNTGGSPVRSGHRLLTTVAYRLGGKPTFAVEGSIFVAGAAVQWLRDGLGVLDHAAETEALAAQAKADSRVVMVPAFTGLGAPHWDAEARGAIFGLTRDTGPAELARAALDAVAHQTDDLVAAMRADGGVIESLRIDGGMVANDWFCQDLSDVTGLPTERPVMTETTAMGAAMLAGVQAGLFASLDEAASLWRAEKRFEPKIAAHARKARRARWQDAVRRTLVS